MEILSNDTNTKEISFLVQCIGAVKFETFKNYVLLNDILFFLFFPSLPRFLSSEKKPNPNPGAKWKDWAKLKRQSKNDGKTSISDRMIFVVLFEIGRPIPFRALDSTSSLPCLCRDYVSVCVCESESVVHILNAPEWAIIGCLSKSKLHLIEYWCKSIWNLNSSNRNVFRNVQSYLSDDNDNR